MILNAIWIALVAFVIITIIRFVHMNTILNYLIRNHKSVYKEYNPEESPKSAMFFIPYRLTPIAMDVFTNKLMLDENLKRIIYFHRFLVILHGASIVVMFYMYFLIAY